jgi:chemotaxis protein MotB
MGGAWKVAYADFVTAMMALFMVLWIAGQDEEIIIKTVKYFKDPFGVGFDDGKPRGSLHSQDNDSGDPFALKKPKENKMSLADLAFLNKLAKNFYDSLNIDAMAKKKKKIDVEVTPDGLKITVFDQSDDPVFIPNTADFTEWGDFVVRNLAWVMDRNQFNVRIDSHTPTGFKSNNPKYGPWELTTDRSNAVRRLLNELSLRKNEVSQVSGFADTQPLPHIPPESEENQRIEIALEL